MANRLSVKFYEADKDLSEIRGKIEEIFQKIAKNKRCDIGEMEEDGQKKLLVYYYAIKCFVDKIDKVAKIKDDIIVEVSGESSGFSDVNVHISKNGEWEFLRDYTQSGIFD